VTYVVVALVGVLIGVGLGILAAWVYLSHKHSTENRPEPEVRVPEQLRTLFAALASPVVLVGPHDEVLEASARATQLSLVRGSRIVQPDLLEMVRASRLDSQQRSSELSIARGRGVPSTHLDAHVTRLDDDLMIVVAEDSTDSRRMSESKRDFVANISHELKTPIGAISLLAEAVDGAADEPDMVRKFAGRLHHESARLGELVQQIINLSRLQSDDPMLKAVELDVDDVLAQAVDRCRPLAEQHAVTLTLGQESGARVLADADQLVDAVANLVHNAIVYSEEKARVAVSARATEQDGEPWVDLSVSDNGIGISEDDQRRIFERFYRVDYGRSRASGGTGLGLSIVSHVAAAHGGSVSVWSKPGQGSTFTVRLPAIVNEGTTS